MNGEDVQQLPSSRVKSKWRILYLVKFGLGSLLWVGIAVCGSYMAAKATVAAMVLFFAFVIPACRLSRSWWRNPQRSIVFFCSRLACAGIFAQDLFADKAFNTGSGVERIAPTHAAWG